MKGDPDRGRLGWRNFRAMGPAENPIMRSAPLRCVLRPAECHRVTLEIDPRRAPQSFAPFRMND